MAHKHDTIDDYISRCNPAVRPLLEELRSFVLTTLPGATEGMQYGAPIFRNAHGVPVIYLFGSETHANFGFLRSSDLTDPDGILKGSGTPSKHIRVQLGKPFDKALLSEFVRQCETINTNS